MIPFCLLDPSDLAVKASHVTWDFFKDWEQLLSCCCSSLVCVLLLLLDVVIHHASCGVDTWLLVQQESMPALEVYIAKSLHSSTTHFTTHLWWWYLQQGKGEHSTHQFSIRVQTCISVSLRSCLWGTVFVCTTRSVLFLFCRKEENGSCAFVAFSQVPNRHSHRKKGPQNHFAGQ